MRLHEFDQTTTPTRSTQYPRYSVEDTHDEAQFEDWLHANPAFLLDERHLIFARQPTLRSGTPDLLALDQYGNVVIFEIKTGDSGSESASEGSIIGQPLTYAQTLAPYEYERLDDLYQQYRDRVLNGRWEATDNLTPPKTLRDSFEAKFGRKLGPDQFNDKQRVVVVAETISSRTAENARYLYEQGYHIQCRQVRFFSLPDQDATKTSLMVASTTVVDWPLRDVRPENKGHPAYPEINRDIIQRTHREIGNLVRADTPQDLVQGFDERQPRIQSRHPDHPDSVTYRLYVNPEQNSVLIAIDINPSDEPANAQIANHRAKFHQHGFQVTGNTRNRVVIDSWLVEHLEALDDETLNEISRQYATLVRIGHDVFVGSSKGES